jgi:O-acetyl-ADP-ribose deacetylase (regulator of RNase III)
MPPKRAQQLKDLPTWKVAGPNYYPSHPLPTDAPLFPVSDAVNDKVSFWMRGDSAQLQVDAIVNAADPGLPRGDGMSAVIHQAAGPRLAAACKQIGHVATGKAALTDGFSLPAKYVIHAVGPVGEDEPSLVKTYRSTLSYLDGSKIRSIGLCCISTGIFGYPIRSATHVALRTVREFLDSNNNLARTDRIVFVVYDPGDVDVYLDLAPLYFPLPGLGPVAGRPRLGARRPPPPNSYLANVSRPVRRDLSSLVVRLSDYNIGKKLGSGRFGQVFVAHDRVTGAVVAVKTLTCDMGNDDDKRSFEREVEILAGVRHPAVLSLHGWTGFVDNPAILTEYMARGSLDAVLKLEKKGRAPAEWTLTRKRIVLLGVASGMMFMHKHRFIHRDLKPGNILLDDHFEPKIADFGLSKPVEAGATYNQSVYGGTPVFMAPEIFAEAAFDFKVDVYAFAVVMYVVLTGLDPFPGTTMFALSQKVIGGDRPRMPDPPPPAPLWELICACWRPDPRERPKFSDILYRLGEVCLEDIDLAAFQEYQARVAPPDLIAPI